MSDVERFWNAVSAKFGDNRKWNQLNQMEQMQVLQGVNMILSVLKG